MSDTTSRTARITTIVVAAATVAVIGGVAFGATRSGAPADAAAPSTPAKPSQIVSGSAASSAPASSAAAPTAATATSPAPQPTETSALRSVAPISSGLTAKIVSMKSLRATATQPGQVGGPAVRFTVRLTNTGTSAVDLSSTVLNVYTGIDQEPAYQLDSDGIVFPSRVAAGRSVVGTATFTIPTADRRQVEVTVDTSTAAPVVAFRGAAPQ